MYVLLVSGELFEENRDVVTWYLPSEFFQFRPTRVIALSYNTRHTNSNSKEANEADAFSARCKKIPRQKGNDGAFLFELESREISFRAPALLLNGLSRSHSRNRREAAEWISAGRAGRQFRNNTCRGSPASLEKRLAPGPLYRGVDRKFLDPIPLSTRDARESYRIQRISGLLLLYRPVVT